MASGHFARLAKLIGPTPGLGELQRVPRDGQLRTLAHPIRTTDLFLLM